MKLAKAAVAKQRLSDDQVVTPNIHERKNIVNVGSGVFYGVRAKML
jgi:hypothetical protein